MMNFKREQKPGDDPFYVYRENGMDVTIYYGEPPMKKRGVWIMIRTPGSSVACGYLVRPLERFDAEELETVVRQFELFSPI